MLSASFLLLGLWQLVAPTLAGEHIATRCLVLAVLACYLAALSAVVSVFCRWQRGNPDAVGASLVGCLSVIGMGISLDLLALDAPVLTAALGLGVAVASLTAWWFWNRCCAAPCPRSCIAPLLLLLLLSCAWPGLMGQALHGGHDHGHGVLGPAWSSPMACWAAGIACCLIGGLLAAGACLQPDVARPHGPVGGHALPYLASGHLRRLLTLLLFTGVAVHGWVIGYIANLDMLLSDQIVLAGVLLVGATGLLGPCRRLRWDVLAFALPVLAELARRIMPPEFEELSRGPSGLQQVVDAVLAPEPVLLLGLWAGMLLAWRTQRPGFLIGAGLCLVGLVTVWDAKKLLDWHVVQGLVAAGALLLAWCAWMQRCRQVLGMAMALSVFLLLWAFPDAMGPNPRLGLLIGVPSAILLASGLRWQELVSRREVSTALWTGLLGLIIGVADASWPWRLLAGNLWLLLVLLSWRQRRGPALLAPLLPPLAYVLAEAWLFNAGWIAVATAFLLLAVALLAGRHRLRLHACPLPTGSSPSLERPGDLGHPASP